MKWNFFLSLVLACVMFVAAPGASANTLPLVYSYEFSMAQEPQGTPPWLTALFDDTADSIGANGVRLTLSTSGLQDSEYVLQWLFNFSGTAGDLTFHVVDNGDAPPVNGTPVGSNDAYGADGSGYYDIKFEFSNANDATRFTAGESITYDIEYTSAIDVSDFEILSTGGGNGEFISAAQIGSIMDPVYCSAQNPDWNGDADCGSGWIAGGYPPQSVVPVPPAVWLFASGLLGLVGIARRKRAT